MSDISSDAEPQLQPEFVIGMTEMDRRRRSSDEVSAIFEMKVDELISLGEVPVNPRPDRLLHDRT